MRRFTYLGIAAALFAASFVTAVTVLAEEEPAAKAAPLPQKKIDHAFLSGLVGDWNVKTSGEGPQGPMSGSGRAHFALAARDTILVQEYESDVLGGMGGHGVAKVSDDGKTLQMWWFSSHAAEPVLLTGTLTETSAEVSGTCPEGTVDIKWKKVDGGYDFQMSLNGKPSFTDTYRKSSG